MNKRVYCLEINKLNSWKKSYFSLSKNESQNFVYKDGIFENFESRRVSDDKVKKKSFFSISPDYYWTGENWSLVQNDPLDEVTLDLDNLINLRKKDSSIGTLKFNFHVSWVEQIFIKKSVDLELKSIEPNKFRAKLESLKHSPHFYLNLDLDVKKNYSIHNCLLKKNSDVYVKGEVIFFHEALHKQVLSISFEYNNAKKVKKQNLFFNLPKNNTFDIWKKDLTYYSNDIVFFNDNLYTLNDNLTSLKENITPDESKNWKLFEFIGNSFFDSKYGSKLFSDLKERLNFYLEKKIGNKIILTFLEKSDLPLVKLNNYFFHDKCKYRIISIVKKYMGKKTSIELTGLEILPLSSWTLDKFPQIEYDNLNYDICVEPGNKFFYLRYPTDSIFSQSKEIKLNVEERL